MSWGELCHRGRSRAFSKEGVYGTLSLLLSFQKFLRVVFRQGCLSWATTLPEAFRVLRGFYVIFLGVGVSAPPPKKIITFTPAPADTSPPLCVPHPRPPPPWMTPLLLFARDMRTPPAACDSSAFSPKQKKKYNMRTSTERPPTQARHLHQNSGECGRPSPELW